MERPIISFEQWAYKNGKTTTADVDSHIHAGLRSAPTTKTYAKWNALTLRDLQEQRDAAKEEYRHAVASGLIPLVEVTRIERLQEAARGIPELEATQAARRLLEKMGVPMNTANKWSLQDEIES